MSAAYPEHAKLADVQEDYSAVTSFLDAITSDGVQLCRVQEMVDGSGTRAVEPRWMPQDWRAIVSAHFGIDENALERERRSMLAKYTGGTS